MQYFAAKRNALFACLDDVSSELKVTSLDQSIAVTALRKNDLVEVEMNYRQGGNRQENKQ